LGGAKPDASLGVLMAGEHRLEDGATDVAERAGEARPYTHHALAYLRASIIVLVVAHHVATGYSIVVPAEPATSLSEHLASIHAISPIVDDQRSGLLSLFAGFNDSFFMSLLFLLSGLFAWGGLERKGRSAFLRHRAQRLGLPLLAMVVMRPLTYYPTYLAAGGVGGLSGFWAEWSAIEWRGGPLWFLELLLLFDLIVVLAAGPLASLARALARMQTARLSRPLLFFIPFVGVSALAYLPLSLATGSFYWVQVGPAQLQINRILLYAIYFSAGLCLGMAGIERTFLAEGARLGRHWLAWTGVALLCFAVSVGVSIGGASDFIGGLAYVFASATISFSALALFLRFARTRNRVLESAFANSYGIYVIHYGIVSWLLFALLGVSLPAIAKWSLVFPAALALSWGATASLRRIPGVARVL